ncbi:MAG: hypothetical protein B0D91_13170 [Oceanospirillales bacterium LUC14_002_19_P2]|nr:MAG: hypothetical protein B0D91_13170 [Oceanospirillales bacterium LUC14_002_19_P2]
METLSQLLQANPSSASVTGEWFCISWLPDLATGERLNIGVAFQTEERLYCKMLDYFERLKCLYGEGAIYHVQLISDVINEMVGRNQTDALFPQVMFERKGFAQGEAVTEILSGLYDDTVTLATRIRKKRERVFNSISNATLYTSLVDELKHRAGLDFNRFVPSSPTIAIDDDNGSRSLYVPFRTESNCIGGLASAVYASSTTVELNLLKAARDVETAQRIRGGDNPSVFILKPGDELKHLPREQADQIEDKLDKFDWYMSQQGIYLGSHVEVGGLAEEIQHWANAA